MGCLSRRYADNTKKFVSGVLESNEDLDRVGLPIEFAVDALEMQSHEKSTMLLSKLELK